MKKLFAVVLSALFVAAVAVPALATDARQTALGSVGNYIEDDFNIFTWYGTLPSYSNTVWIGLDYSDYYYYLGAPADDGMMSGFQPYMGASYGLGSEGKYGTLAMFFNYSGRPLNYFDAGWDSYNTPFTSSAPSKWNVMYGYAMEKLSFGVYFSRSDYSDKYEESLTDSITPDEEEAVKIERLSKYEDFSKLAYTTVGAGVRFDIGEKMYADFAFDLNMASMTERPDTFSRQSDYWGYGEVTADANKMLNFRARMFYEWNETITWVPSVSFTTFNFSLKGDHAKDFDQNTYYYDDYYTRKRGGIDDTLAYNWKDTHYGVKGMNATLGIGANIKVNENNLLVFAVEPFSYTKLEQSDAPADTFIRYEDYPYYYYAPYYWTNYTDPYSWGKTYETKYTVMPTFRLALESDVRDWLTFRIGAVKEFYKVEETESYSYRTKDYYPTDPVRVNKYESTDTWTGSDFGYWMGLGFHVGDFDIDAVVNNNLPFRVGYWLTGYENNSYDGPPVYQLSAAYHF